MDQPHDLARTAEAAAAHPAPPTPLLTIGILAALVPVIAGYVVLGTVLGVPAFYMGFLFATYWGALRGLALPDFVPAVLGALTGIGLAWLLHALPLALGVTGLLLALAATMAALFLMIRQQAQLFVNPAFVVFLTVATIPALTLQDNHLGMVAGMAFGAAYAGALVLLLSRLAAMRRAKAVAADPA